MKSFLALDTASGYLTVLTRDREGKKTVSFLPDCATRHSVLLLETVEKTVAEAGLSLSDFDFFACVTGAGSFTGIRIGIATVKGLCTAFDRPALGVTSFDAIAWAVQRGRVLSAIDAGHGYYYICGFDENRGMMLAPAYCSAADVCSVLEQGRFVAAGYEILPFENALLADMSMGLLAAVSAKADDEANLIAGENLAATYVRKSQAEENRK